MVRNELDEALFEEALAALNLDTSAEASTMQPFSTEQGSAGKLNEDSLSDEALLNALVSNPELFP
jgi:arsenate reductase-like glutaredoxin family protein